MKALGFDFGLARIGVALANTELRLANPLCTIESTNRKTRWDNISDLIEEWRPQRLVVGLPQYLNGDNSELTERAERFARQLAGRYDLGVDLIPEQLTSQEAERRLKQARQSGRKNKIKKAEVDQLAAAIILETWLEQHDHE